MKILLLSIVMSLLGCAAEGPADEPITQNMLARIAVALINAQVELILQPDPDPEHVLAADADFHTEVAAILHPGLVTITNPRP